MFDTHTHLIDDQLFPAWRDHLQTFANNGGCGLVNMGTNSLRNQRVIQIAKAYIEEGKGIASPESGNTSFLIGCALGVDPEEIAIENLTPATWQPILAEALELQKTNPDLVWAIGECGVDLYYDNSAQSLRAQQDLLMEHCRIAEKLNLPLIIHSRNCFQETIAILSEWSFLTQNSASPSQKSLGGQARKGGRLVFHCFGYSPKDVEFLLSHFPNVYFGFDGNITYPNAHALRESCIEVPLERVLLETDAPYLPPQNLRGTMNVPANIRYIYDFVADLKGLDSETAEKVFDTNAKVFYGKY